MKLWHKNLIIYLPEVQLIEQWKDCYHILEVLLDKGTLDNVSVNEILNYPLTHFASYTYAVLVEIRKREYNLDANSLVLFINNLFKLKDCFTHTCEEMEIYEGWHDDDYLKECLHSLEEQVTIGNISIKDWSIIYDRFKDITPLYKPSDT